MTRRLATALARIVVVLVATAGPAAADPPAPTDYRSEVDGLSPAVDGVTARVIGGDSFLELVVIADAEVVVVGYQGEAYLRFDPDGRVYENQRSPSKPLNEDRFGEGDLTGTDAEVEPDWEQVSEGGTHQWHDHRTHWMQTDRPFGKQPGDRILEGVVPLQVDGQEVDIRVSSTWIAGPSPVAALIGGAVAVLVAAAVIAWGRPVVAWLPVLVAATAALVVGVWQVSSVPAATGPPRTAWLLPALALAFALSAAVLHRRGAATTVVVACATVTGVELVLWAWLRRDGLFRALLPTDAPWALDRSVTVAVAVVGLIAIVDLLRRSGLVPLGVSRSDGRRPASPRPPSGRVPLLSGLRRHRRRRRPPGSGHQRADDARSVPPGGASPRGAGS